MGSHAVCRPSSLHRRVLPHRNSSSGLVLNFLVPHSRPHNRVPSSLRVDKCVPLVRPLRPVHSPRAMQRPQEHGPNWPHRAVLFVLMVARGDAVLRLCALGLRGGSSVGGLELWGAVDAVNLKGTGPRKIEGVVVSTRTTTATHRFMWRRLQVRARRPL
ncbi:hypothetical protein BD413DRAFT_280374 [Trametes elegans]|nr:hypothetical protein BD413DRAFT_280374 [Trametes elegans]